jgi:MoaA/NifB/PqqE/SkfB family radical SAM enzyme
MVEPTFETFPVFVIDVTSRCNFRCRFCYKEGREQPADMSLEGFKHIIKQIVEQFPQDKPRICISGGEPFLNKHVVDMAQYAVKNLGEGNVELTTNGSRLPRTDMGLSNLIGKLKGVKLNLSVDEEHLQFGTHMKTRITKLMKAVRNGSANVNIISTAIRTPVFYEDTVPENIRKLIPSSHSPKPRLDFHAMDEAKVFRAFFEGRAQGNFPMMPSSVMQMLGYAGITSDPYSSKRKVNLTFSPDGKVYISQGFNALYFPQLSVGSWKRESLRDIIKTNLPFKHAQIRQWLGTDPANPRKRALMAKYVVKRFDKEVKRRATVKKR